MARVTPTHPGFIVLRQTEDGTWQIVGEVDRQPGLTARAARTKAISDASGGQAQRGEVYAAVLRSEWRIALEW